MILTYLKKLTPIIGLFFAVLILRKDLLNIEFNKIDVAIIPMMLGSLLLLVLFYMDAVGWHLINVMLGIKCDLRESVSVWLLSSLSRYIPGVVWGYANRIIFLKERNAKLHLITLSLMLESLFLAGAALLVGANLLIFPDYFALLQSHININFLFIVFALVLLLILVVIGRRFWSKISFFGAQIRESVHLRKLAVVFLFYLFLWSVFVFAFGLFGASLLPQPLNFSKVVTIGMCFSLSFGLSFLLIIFPGGIGVREMFLYAFLCVSLDPAMAALLAVLSRIWVMVGEMISVGGCWVFVNITIKKKS